MRRASLVFLLLAACGSPGARGGSAPAEGLPYRVHAIEDFETDIEKRWWLAGKPETENVPTGSRRACRGTLSKDFDDKMGDPAARYTAVIFNPVPGPPMGKHTRLRFRCWLRGTDRLRVQIFSLTNNYHRRLELTGLPQGSWQEGNVDMTLLRRPDGTGGPLSEDERIDDIQFYVDPSAELIVDDIILYDAAPDGEKEPFPSRIVFTGGFDTGKQGKEWPGEFEIVAHEKPLKWKAARSVQDKLLVSLRGLRPVNEREVRLKFRYRLTGAAEFTAAAESGSKASAPISVRSARDDWQEARLALPTGCREIDGLLFKVAGSGVLWIDDVLLYDP
ncbi:MAG: hypothetical protein HY293_11480 [Planctomycetes bacterium]|nr:hypothetical protein [Planctomycetota bacterium]